MFGSRKESSSESGKSRALATELRRRAQPLRDASDLDPLIDRIGDARYVLLGEASHGTSEYYTWRAELSKRLIREKGFSFVASKATGPTVTAAIGMRRGTRAPAPPSRGR